MSDHSRVGTPSDADSGSETLLSLRSENHLAPQSITLDALTLRETLNNDVDDKVLQIEEENLLLSVENDILERYLLKVNPALIQGMDKLLEKVNEKMAKTQIIAQSLEPISRATSRLSQISKADSLHSVGPLSNFTLSGGLPASESIKIPHISYEFRNDIVSREMNSMKSKLDKLIVKMKGEKTHIAACLEEVTLRIKDLGEFKKKLTLLPDRDPKSKVSLESYLGLMRCVLKQMRQSINQAKTNMTILSIEKKRVLLRMEDKQELSATIYPIDFDVLLIQNQELRKQLNQKCFDITVAKRFLGNADRSLTSSAVQFDSLCSELKYVQKNIKLNERKLKNIQRKRKMLESEIKRKRKETACADTPVGDRSEKSVQALDVMSYAFTKLCLCDLERKVKIYSRKRQLKLALLSCMRHHFKLLANKSPMNLKKSWVL